MDTHRYRLTLDRWTALAGVPKNLDIAYLASLGVQAFCLIRYFDGDGAPAFGYVGLRPTIAPRCTGLEGSHSRRPRKPRILWVVAGKWLLASKKARLPHSKIRTI